MKSFWKTGLVLFASLTWAASAQAQTDGYATPSLLPLPAVSPMYPTSVPASYSSSGYDAWGNTTTTSRQESLPQPTVPPALSNPNGASDFENALHSPCGEACDTCDTPCRSGTWFGSIGALVMGRNRANGYWTTYETNNNPNQLMNTQNAGANWAGGGQVTAGYMFGNCCCPGPGIAFTYWGLGPMTANSSVTAAPGGTLSSPIDLGFVTIGGLQASQFFDNAHEQRIARDDRFNNFELNLLSPAFYNGGRLTVTGLVGVRYLRFDERLSYSSVADGFNFGDNGGVDQATLAFRTVNNLWGGQVGANMNYMLTDRLGVFVMPKGGIFLNQMNGLTQLYRGDGLYAVNQLTGDNFNYGAHKTDVAFLGEIDTGFSWAFCRNVQAYVGYRVIGIANVALADNQFLPFLADQAGYQQIKQNGALIVHGGMAGIAWSF